MHPRLKYYFIRLSRRTGACNCVNKWCHCCGLEENTKKNQLQWRHCGAIALKCMDTFYNSDMFNPMKNAINYNFTSFSSCYATYQVNSPSCVRLFFIVHESNISDVISFPSLTSVSGFASFERDLTIKIKTCLHF